MLRRRRRPEGPSGAWAVAQGTLDDGAPFILRYDTSASSPDERRARPVRIGIAVPYDTAAGHLSEQQLARVEDRADELAGDRARLVFVITTPTFKEYVFYANDAGWVPEFHLTLRQGFAFDIQMYAEPDPTWSAYHHFLP